MNLEGLRDAFRRKPFVSFSIGLADERWFQVQHPEFDLVGARLVVVINVDDSWSVLEPLLIVSLDHSKPRRGNNGSPKRRKRS